MIEFAALRTQIYNYLTGNNNEDKKAKDIIIINITQQKARKSVS